MYLAPFNYNRFIERLFKKPEIVKRFFEDMLNVVITEIKPFDRKTKLTVDAAYVEFDYRCKIDGQYCILDMQQWYKFDVVKRFYMYHCNNTSLQLETLKPVSIQTTKGKEYKTRDYNQIEPTTTIVWMVDDTLGFKEDIVSFMMTPELLTDFIRSNAWGKNDMETLLQLRAQILGIMDNDTKGLSFLPKNRLIFAFQKNIIKNPKMAKYVRWFLFAEKTKDENNKESDFEEFKNDPIFITIMNELSVNNLSTDDFQYIIDYAAFEKRREAYEASRDRQALEEATIKAQKVAQAQVKEQVKIQVKIQVKEQVKVQVQEVREQARKEYEPKIKEVQNLLEQAEQEKQQAEQEKQQAEQEKQQAEQEKQQAEQEKQQAEQKLLEKELHLIQKFLKRGHSHEDIAELLEIELEQLTYFITLLPKEDEV